MKPLNINKDVVPLNKLERQYVAYWVMNIVADYIPGVRDQWSMNCPSHEKSLQRVRDVILELGGYELHETAE